MSSFAQLDSKSFVIIETFFDVESRTKFIKTSMEIPTNQDMSCGEIEIVFDEYIRHRNLKFVSYIKIDPDYTRSCIEQRDLEDLDIGFNPIFTVKGRNSDGIVFTEAYEDDPINMELFRKFMNKHLLIKETKEPVERRAEK